jgi:hypothetical protein
MPSKKPSAPVTHYQLGDIVFWGTPTAAGKYTFVGYPKATGVAKWRYWRT